MSTEFNFSESMALAVSFAHQLLHGSLNLKRVNCQLRLIHPMNEGKESTLADDFAYSWQDFVLSRIEASDSEVNPESLWAASERRCVRVYVKHVPDRLEKLAVTFDVCRDYLDGDTAVGWTRWSVRNVFLNYYGEQRKLSKVLIDPRDETSAVWI